MITLQQRFGSTKIYQVGRVLEQIAEVEDQFPDMNAVVTPFHSHVVPNISILWYFVLLCH